LLNNTTLLPTTSCGQIPAVAPLLLDPQLFLPVAVEFNRYAA